MWSQTKEDLEMDDVWCQTANISSHVDDEDAPAPEAPYQPGIEPRPKKKSRCTIS